MALKQQVSNVYGVGLRNAGSYVVSGQPFIARRSVNSGNQIKIEFPYVTKNVTIRIPSPPNNALDIGNQDGSWLGTGSNKFSNAIMPAIGGSGKDFAVSFWFKQTVASTSQTLLWNFFPDDAGGWGKNGIRFMYNSTTGTKYLEFEGVGTNVAVTNTQNSAVDIGDKEWHHVLFTQHNGNTYCYVDGQLGGATFAGELDVAVNFLAFGWNGGGGIDSAAYDELSVFETGFTQAEVTEIYNSGEYFSSLSHSQASTLIAWWTMGDDRRDWGGFPITIPPDLSLGNAFPFFANHASNETMDPATLRPPGFLHGCVFNGGGGPANPDFAAHIPGPYTKQSTGKLRVHMLSTGSSPHGANIVANKHYRELSGYNTSISLPMKTKEIYLTGVDAQVTFEVIAELTNIPTDRMYELTGSGIDD